MVKEYIKSLIQKYDYYDPIKDRTEALRVANIKNKNILEIGAGKGYMAVLSAKNFNCNVTAIDISKEKIDIARKNAEKEGISDKIKFKLNDALNLPFKINSFDAAISFNTLHHDKENHEKIISEMFRVAKEKVIITELSEKGAKIFDEYVYPEKNHEDMAINLEELENELKQYGQVKRFDRKLMSTFVCEKAAKEVK